MFDADRNGTIEGTELTHLLEILHEDGQASNLKQALQSFDFDGDGKIDFSEFRQLNALFPSLLYPAFRMQQNMRIHTMGDVWWRKKVEELHADKAQDLARLNAAASDGQAGGGDDASKAQRDAAARVATRKRQEQAIRIRMGCLQYTCCPCRRHLYVVTAHAPDAASDDSDSGSESGKTVTTPPPKRPAATSNANRKTQNIVPVGGARKPLSQEQRLERARKRRLRDMQDRPTRKT